MRTSAILPVVRITVKVFSLVVIGLDHLATLMYTLRKGLAV